MKKHNYLKTLFFLTLFSTLTSCGTDDGDTYTEILDPVSPVVVDISAVPYTKLSEYKFYEGDLKNMEPAYKVLPYDLNSALFTDYAHKKRFIWMPEGEKATYNGDETILDFPTRTVIIKNFYYENVLPDNSTRIIETRLMIKKDSGWIFADYVWNDEQTEAYLDLEGSFTDISWIENGVEKSSTYRIPSESECLTCHKNGNAPIPIGPKPQNMNKMFNYSDGTANQLSKWIEEGYLQDNLPAEITSTIDWTDISQPLELRVRSYMDINCAHCHAEGAHCDYMPMRLAFSETTKAINMGVCVEPFEFISTSYPHIIAKQKIENSVMYYRLSTTNESERMPMLGRSIVHEEGLQLFGDWINNMDGTCP
ncbi:hypothetical protein DVK85_13135 [Flavobacterium arcticum]|uniref:Repeat protein (TIGR03806 family) n=1 Tax=Flavobacterium arcticum TaxID=1784713 RepID=A0A345HEW3_9FLAO|nr:hypothetical protein [Flavobacterium arcticum]AXG75123.1 hypothetical protein DVK85_13135 [Flavobacterium arcticum]KAF2511097.1 hypothetical protein E0W72_06810 [Flavobacterium arcticum]